MSVGKEGPIQHYLALCHLASVRGQYTNYTGCMSNTNLVDLALCESSEYNPLPRVRKSQV